MASFIDHAELIEISGADALSFAHSQFTSAVTQLTEGTWQWSAWLNAQGKTRHVFALFYLQQNQLLAWLPLGGAEIMRTNLTRFVFRAKVHLYAHTHWALSDTNAPLQASLSPNQVQLKNEGLEFQLPGLTPRCAYLSPLCGTPLQQDMPALARWRLADIQSGLPFLTTLLSEEFVPQALGLERLGAIHFQKGCYPGQEIVARLHFRGGNKRSLARLLFPKKTPPPLSGSYLYIDNRDEKIGRILYSTEVVNSNPQALAVLMSDALLAPLRTEAGVYVESIYSDFAL